MQRALMAMAMFVCFVAATAGLGSHWPAFDAFEEDENVRMEQMLNASEELRLKREEWRRFWFTDMPSHLTPQRVHGGITP